MIRTNVGWAITGDNLFRGYSANDELAGNDGYWSLVSLAIGGPRLAADDASFLDDLAVCFLAADPRIWPMKVAWIAGSYGSVFAAIAAAEVYLEGAVLGAWQTVGAATLLQELREVHAQGDGELARWFEPHRERRTLLAGFGVPARTADERVALLDTVVRRHGREERPHYAVFRAMSELVTATSKLRPNIAGAFSACALDMGYAPRQVALLTHCAAYVPLWANATESARLAPPALRLTSDVRYLGPALRRSPRHGGARG